MRTVLKFGGRAVDTGEKVLQVANLIINHRKRGQEVIGVFSAINGMTDQILAISESVKKGKRKTIEEFLRDTHETHIKIVNYSIKDANLKSKAILEIEEHIAEMTALFN
jgi:aspartokinase